MVKDVANLLYEYVNLTFKILSRTFKHYNI